MRRPVRSGQPRTSRSKRCVIRAGHDASEARLHLVRVRRGRDEKGVVLPEGAVGEERVQVHVQAQYGAEALNHEEGAPFRRAPPR
jgi:hypothetical protein